LLLSTARVSTQTRIPRARSTVRINGAEAVEGEVLVKYHYATTADVRARVEVQADVESSEGVGGLSARLLRSRSLTVETLLALMKNNPAVEYAEPNLIYHTFVTPNDPSFPLLWGLQNTGQTIGGPG